MKETRNFTLPVIGKVQHGEQIIQNGKKRVKEHGYFIAKIQIILFPLKEKDTILEERFVIVKIMKQLESKNNKISGNQ